MIKILGKFVLTVLLTLIFSLSSFATINSVSDINSKIRKLNKIVNYDYINMITKSELIGDRLQEFNMSTSQYKNEVKLVSKSLKNITNQIKLIEDVKDIPDSEKLIQTSKLYQDAETLLYTVDSKTTQYIFSVRSFMPTITYQRYSKKFLNFYNSLDISDSNLSLMDNNKSNKNVK